jgi:hypothetical protein
METLDLILRFIGAFTLIRWTFKAFYWYFIIDRSGNAGRYGHYLDER